MNLKTQTNAKGVTLSAGLQALEETKPAAVTDAKRVAGSKPKQTKAEKKAAKAAAVKDEAKQAAAEIAAPAPVVDADGNPLPVRRSIVPKRFKQEYKAHGGTCGDDMALELKAATTVLNADKRPSLDWPKLKAIAEANGIPTASYEGLNNGQKRMNVGNKLRGKLAEGHDVVVEGRTFKAEDWEPKVPRKAKPAEQAQAS